MREKFSKILIGVILMGIFMLPLSASFERKESNLAMQVKINTLHAQGPVFSAAGEETVPPGIDLRCKLIAGIIGTVANQSGPGVIIKYTTGYKIGGETNLAGCIAELTFGLWQASAWIARGAGAFLDYFVYYSINSEAYDNNFISRGWGVVRDITNVFFIIALLYVAIKTILSLNVSDNKRLVGTIVIIALLINFSLFATEVIIDASNVIAKIFYNGIAPSDSNGVKGQVNAGGEKSISVAMVAKYNPQSILGAGGDAQKAYDAEGGTATFIFVTLVLLALTLYTAYIFMSVSILFASRVIALWLSMIFSAFSFASYTVPFKIPGFGHEDWWPELFKNAFLAPVFIFFLYLIVMFLDIGIFIPYQDTSSLIAKVMSAVIPFAAIYILLTQAKKVAVKMSGEIGAGVVSATKLAIGVAGAAALGTTAIAGRALIGRLGSVVANSGALKNAESSGVFGAKALRNLGKYAGSGSFDLRQVKIKGKGLGSLTGADFGEGKKGGFEQMKKDKTEKRMKRAKELEVGESEQEKQNLNNVQREHQDLLRTNSHEIEQIDKQIKTARENMGDLDRAARNNPAGMSVDPISGAMVTNGVAAASASRRLADLKGMKRARKRADTFTDSTGTVHDFTANVSTLGRSIDQLEDTFIPAAHHALEALNRERRFNLAGVIESRENKVYNYLSSFGQHSGWGADEAAHKIIMEVKLDSGDKH